MLAERNQIYEELKNDKEKLYNYKYKTEKEWKEEFEFLKEVPSQALQQVRMDLNQSYKNFYRRLKQEKNPGFPKFKKKGKCKDSYRDPQVGRDIRFNDNFTKLDFIKIKGLPNNFTGKIKSVTVSRTKSGNILLQF
jgi:putative transposase